MTVKLKQVPNYFDSLLHDILITIERKGGETENGLDITWLGHNFLYDNMTNYK